MKNKNGSKIDTKLYTESQLIMNRKNRNLKHSDHWRTPLCVYSKLDKEFNFDFDPCPLHSDFDGLTANWGRSNFVNPPYSLKLKTAFVKKAIEESKLGKTCVMLLPVSTSTVLFHDYILKNNKEIRFVKGRIKFIGYNIKGELVSDKTGMHDSMIVVF